MKLIIMLVDAITTSILNTSEAILHDLDLGTMRLIEYHSFITSNACTFASKICKRRQILACFTKNCDGSTCLKRSCFDIPE